ncbi:hypothetical protein [Kitasatospora sp. NPDC058218]|uniref:hypothetical protein n=1 Tax=Kitasatospora sp. NPDC058218 TaxID=3346385 RepID=UPI0036DB2C97
MHQNRNGVQVGVGFGVAVPEGRGEAVGGCPVVGGTVVGADGAGAADSGAPLFVAVAGAVLLVGTVAEVEAVADPLGVGPVRSEVGLTGAVVTPVAAAGAAEGVALGDGVATGPSATGGGGAPSVPLAVSAATPSPATARPATESTSTPGRRADRRPARREPTGGADQLGSGSGEPTADGGGTAASGGVSRVSARAPQPGQVIAPFR